MRYFVDLEFNEERGNVHGDDPGREVDPISLAVVAEDGREIYVVNEDYVGDTYERDSCNDWVKENVLPNLMGAGADRGIYSAVAVTDRAGMRESLVALVGDDPSPEFWGYVCPYDWYLTCRLFGRFDQQPESWNRGGNICHDVKTLAMTRGVVRPGRLVPKPVVEHNALLDARWTREVFLKLLTMSPTSWPAANPDFAGVP